MTGFADQPAATPGHDNSFATIPWAEAFESETFKLISKKRFSFVVPALLLYSAVFFALWVMQSSFPAISRYRIYGWVNINFVFTMAIFPFVWILGYLFVRYTRTKVYPLEEQLHREFRKEHKNA